MTSMRTLNRRLLRWRRYESRTGWNPRVTRPAWMGPNTAVTTGHWRAWDAWTAADERRRCRPARCRRCGCTDDQACPGGCGWATPGQVDRAGLNPALGPVCTACLPDRGPVVDDEPRCTLGPPTGLSTCYCTGRPGCPGFRDDEDLDVEPEDW